MKQNILKAWDQSEKWQSKEWGLNFLEKWEQIKNIEQRYRKRELSENKAEKNLNYNESNKKSFLEQGSSKNISPALKKPSSKSRPMPERELGVNGLKKNPH